MGVVQGVRPSQHWIGVVEDEVQATSQSGYVGLTADVFGSGLRLNSRKSQGVESQSTKTKMGRWNRYDCL